MQQRLSMTLVVPFALVLMAGTANAYDECDSDADCIDGFVCEVVGGSTCAVICPAGEECYEDPECEPAELSICVPGPCRSDDDCAEGLRCLEVEYGGDCPVTPPCEEGEECPEPDPDCGEVITESFCLPPWIAPCETDAECGEGFECVPDEICTCSGSSGEPDPDPEPRPDPEDPDPEPDPGDPDDDDPEDDPDCTCEPTDESYCRPREIDCTDDSECPEGWTCEEIPSVYPCWVDEDGVEHCDEPPESGTEGMCMPPFFDDIGWGASAGGDGDGDVDMDDVFEAATGAENARPTGNEAGGDADGDADGGHRASGGSSGCQAAPGAAGGTAAALWMLPLLIGLFRSRS